jgi:serine/threonine protein kinase
MVRHPTLTARKAGDEPVPGYRLIQPIGEGGFGQVWKCEAPGGLHKAIKFVSPSEEGACPAAQELASLQRVISLRHPFILSLDRMETCEDGLIIIMELADQNLHERFMACQAQGLPGIPRDELLSYLHEAAEALDWMSFEHGLQHLDVKPHNLFLISGHVKVADFGLVHDLGEGGVSAQSPRRQGGTTPIYSAPELLRGGMSRTSDQYSLAVLYQQMLTGTLPFWHANVYDLMMMHLTGEPDLSSVPPGDHPALLRALSKVPDQRFGSCMELVQALASAQGEASGMKRSGQWRRILSGPRTGGEGAAAPSGENLKDTPTRRVRSVNREPVPTGLEGNGSPQASPSRTPSPRPALDGPLPTAVSLPGFRFRRCISQTPLGDLWEAEDASGSLRRGLALLGYVRYDARLITHLQALRDPMLPATEVHWSPAERLVLLTDPCDGALRDRFEACVAAGQPGIPRAELLGLLRSVAEALDRLHARYGIQHLGLHPKNILLDEGEARVADFGVIPLAWLPTGEPVTAVNARYSAPELFDRRPSTSADQYSLALIYAEMLTGLHPRPARPGSGLFRRPGPRPSGASRTVRLDLSLLPAHDRDAVSRALASEPGKRFPSCTAFIEALEQAGAPTPPTPDLYAQLPPVIPYGSLMGDPPGPDTVLPEVPRLVVSLLNNPGSSVEGPSGARYRVHADGSWEHRCPLQLFPGAMDLKVAGLLSFWNARVLSHEGDQYRLDFEAPGPKSFWDAFRSRPRVTVDIHVEPNSQASARLAEAVVRVSYKHKDQAQASRLLGHISPKVFETVRTYFQAAQEQRGKERFPLTLPARLYPVLPDLEVAEAIDATTRNISFGGMSLLVKARPPVEVVYLHLPTSPQALGYAVLARVVRCREAEGGWEVGLRFVGA